MFSSNEQSKNITIILSVLISFLAVAIITYAATTISTNINTGGILTVSGNATSTFGTGGLTVGSSQFVVQQTSGNVGIGLSSPTSTLAVLGGFHAQRSTGAPGLFFDGSTGNVGLGTTSPWGLLAVQTPAGAGLNSLTLASTTPSGGADTHLVVTKSGNVGIGTVPDIDTSNTFHVRRNTAGISIFGEAISDGSWQARGVNGIGHSSGSQVGIGVFGQGKIVNSADTADSVGVGAYVNDLHTGGKNIAFRVFSIQSGAQNYSFYSDSTVGVLYNQDNVGIGTTTPIQKLNVYGGNVAFQTTSNSATAFQILNSATTSVFTVDTIYGRVGIGTTTPTTMFQVATSTTNATTTMEVGKANQNKGSCIILYDGAGTKYFCSVQGGTFTCSATTCE